MEIFYLMGEDYSLEFGVFFPKEALFTNGGSTVIGQKLFFL